MFDWFWNTFISPWPDVKAGTIEIRDIANLSIALLSVALGCLSVRLARLSIKRGLEQDAMTQRQVKLAEEQKALLAQLGDLTAKQAELAQIHHSIFEREQAQRAVLKVVAPTPRGTNLNGPTVYRLFVLNDGDRSESGYWYLGIPKSISNRVDIRPARDNEEIQIPSTYWDIEGTFDQPGIHSFTLDYVLFKFRMNIPVDPGAMAPCAELSVTWEGEARDQSQRIFLSFSRTVRGRFPERGMRKLRLYGSSEAVFKAQYGGVVLPPDDPDVVGG